MTEPRQRLCATVTGATMADLRARRDAMTGCADLVELRLDSVADPDVAAALADRQRPVIITCRPRWEGGLFDGSEDARRQLLQSALEAGAEYVDVEVRAGFDDLIARRNGRRIVLSLHDFDQVPDDLEDRLRLMKGTGAEVVKIAVQARRLSDCLTLAALGRAHEHGLVLIAMGEQGAVTRMLPSRFHSMWTYAGSLSGIGQMSAETLVNQFRFHQITTKTDVYGIAGFPVGHSASPAMHNAAFREAGLDAVYLPLPARDAEDFVTFARAFGLKGASITIPYKSALMREVDEVSPVASRIGAINTLRVEDARWIGDNSDAEGFLAPLRSRAQLSGLRASLLGAGGAARAVAVGLASNGASVRVHARDAARAEAVAGLVAGSTGAWPPERGSWDLLVNCTPIGMYPDVGVSPIPPKALGGGIVYDLVYNPMETRLLQDAKAAGCPTIGGLEMLLSQAQQQFEWWTGMRPSAEVMRAAALTRLGEMAAGVARIPTVNADAT
jgi:3-dehydroquinate dehydratase/shikimate dehydrogenase